MKQLLTLTLTLLSFSALYAQNNIGLTLFSENGERFILYVNGEQINDEAQANVKVMDISADMIQARVDFEDGSLNDFSSNVMLHPGFMANYMIKVNRKGKYVIRFQSEAPYKSDDVSAEPLIHVPASGSQTEIIEQESQTDGVTLSTSGQVTTTSTTTTTTTKGGNTDTDKVEMKMTVPGMDVEISMAGGVDMEGSSMESTTTVTETITTTSGTRTIENQELTRPTTEVIEIGGCEGPVDEMSFAQMKKSIAGKTFEDSKFTLAKQIAQSNCLWAEQVKEIKMLFDFEDTKLEFAKLAYDSTVDQGSYYIVNDAFEFELTIDELNEYLEMR